MLINDKTGVLFCNIIIKNFIWNIKKCTFATEFINNIKSNFINYQFYYLFNLCQI